MSSDEIDEQVNITSFQTIQVLILLYWLNARLYRLIREATSKRPSTSFKNICQEQARDIEIIEINFANGREVYT